ncbi:MAG TPA: S9 family peptidase [Streptosporangiaceae bacterium]|nr:S9 family peptidase [Streptosporangiaceae bacterium]
MTQFHDLQEYLAIPRIENLTVSPDGRRLVVVVKTLSADRKKYTTALWEIDPSGERPPHRLTRSAEGESGPAFGPDGTLLFVSARPGPSTDKDGAAKDGAEDDEDDKPSLWALPAPGGEATRVATRPGGLSSPVVARQAGTVVFIADTLPGDAADDAEGRKLRADAGISAILHEQNPVRYWDHQLGPDQPRLFLLDGAPDLAGAGPAVDGPPAVRDLTPDAGQALVEQSADVTPDGATVVTGWYVPDGRGGQYSDLVAVDGATGQRRTLLTRERTDFTDPKISPDGRTVVCATEATGSLTEVLDNTLWLVSLDGTESHDLLPGLDLWPGEPTWAPDSATLYFGADQRGRHPVFAVDVATGSVRQVTQDDAAYTSLSVTPDGRSLYALRTAVGTPPTPVRIDASTGEVAELAAPGLPLERPGRLTEITAAAPDGTEIRSWLVLPEPGPEPAPLLLWVHGGPYSSWNAWSWRWNPWIMAAHGYAVLLPDPALSTGYGQTHIRRGYGRWGDATFDDLMAITDAALARDDIDQSRTAMMGGSFGGYMANWIAGHTDRFGAIVAHASLWKFDAMLTSDASYLVTREFGEPTEQPGLWEANDPSRHAGKVRTPMLVIHGDKDYRVPIGNALYQWWDLTRNQVEAKFLYYPDENHWILTPGNITIWYETVLAFLAQHVLGQPWRRPKGL